MMSLNETMPGVLYNILSFLKAPDLAAVSETSMEMCRFVRVNDKLWQSLVPNFPCKFPLGGDVDPRHINGFENLTFFCKAKQLQEYKNKVITAFRKRRMRKVDDSVDWTYWKWLPPQSQSRTVELWFAIYSSYTTIGMQNWPPPYINEYIVELDDLLYLRRRYTTTNSSSTTVKEQLNSTVADGVGSRDTNTDALNLSAETRDSVLVRSKRRSIASKRARDSVLVRSMRRRIANL